MTAATVERALCAAHLYKPTRDIYQRLMNREYVQYRQAGRAFYSQFVTPGDLVFDVGANRGHMSEMFLELGARVVAMEPTPNLADLIRRRYPSRRLTVEPCAVSEQAGTTTLHLGGEDGHSSMDVEWINRVRSHEKLSDRWGQTITVPVLSLDELIAKHGVPVFIKIDVEGHESKVLAGLTEPVPALSFEYQCPALDMTKRALDALDGYQFQFSAGESLAFLSDRWLTSREVMAGLEERREADPLQYGDVYARRV